MADETAKLVLAVDSTSAKTATADLDRLTASSAKAEAATGKLGTTSGTAGRAVKTSADATSVAAVSAERLAETEEQATKRIHDMVQASLAAVEASKAHAAATLGSVRAAGENAAAAVAQGKSLTDLARAQNAAMTNYGKFTTLARNASTAIEALKGGAITTAAYEKAVNDLGKAVDVGAISQVEYVAALKLADKAKIQDIAVTKAQLLSSRAQSEIATAASEIAAGNFGRLRRTGAAFANQAGLLTKLMSPMGLAILGVSGTVIALVTAFAKGEAEQAAFNKALILTGGYSGQTAGQLHALAESMDGLGGATQHAAAGVIAQVVQSGKFFGDQIKTVSAAALELQQTTGQAVDKTIEEFVKLGKDPVKGLLDLNQSMHFLTQSTYDQVTALVQRGQTDKAAEVAQQAYAAAVGQRAQEVQENLGILQSAWSAVGNAAKQAWDEMLNVGRPTTIQDRIADVTRQLNAAKAALASPGDISASSNPVAAARGIDLQTQGLGRAALATRVKDLQDQLRDLQNKQRADSGIAAGQALSNRLIGERIAAQEAGRQGALQFDKAGQEKSELDDIATQRAKALLGVVDPAKQAQINQEFDSWVAGVKARYEKAAKSIAGGSKSNPLSGLQSLVNSAGVSSLTVANNKPVTDYVQTVAKLTTAFDEARKKGADLGAAENLFAKGVASANLKLKEQQDQIEQGNNRAFAQFKATLDDQVAAQKNAIDIQVASVGMGQKEADRARKLNELDQQRIQQVQRLQRAQATHPEQYAELQRRIDAVNASFADMRDSMIDGFHRMDTAQADWRDGFTAALQDFMDQAANVAGQTGAAFSNLFNGMADAVANFVKTGKFNLEDLATSFLADVARMEAAAAEAAAIKWLTGLFGGGSAINTQQVAAGNFVGPHANGGVYNSPSLARYEGGVYNTPHYFGFANGGVFGEAGNDSFEAIMPLGKGPDGKLGVKAQGSGTTVIVENHTDSKAQVQQSKDSNGGDLIRVIVGAAVNEVDKRIARGGSTGQVIQQAFGLSRRGVPVAG